MRELGRRLRGSGNSLLASLSMRTGLNLNRPTYICAKMTMHCNSRCLHCNIWKMNFGEQELTSSEWRAALNNLREWLGPFSMVFTGGEALLRSDMVEILSHASALGIRAELLSNGLIVDDDVAKRLVSAGIARFTTSLDGFRPETHDHFRGREGFHRLTLRAIEALRLHRGNGATQMEILLKTVISHNNFTELIDIARFARDRGLRVLFQPIEQNYGDDQDPDWYRESPLWIRDTGRLRQELASLRELKRQGYPILNGDEEFETIARYFEHPDELMSAVQGHDTRTAAGACRHAVTNFVISSNGDVRMCFRMEPIGNLRDASPRELWSRRKRCWAGTCGYR